MQISDIGESPFDRVHYIQSKIRASNDGFVVNKQVFMSIAQSVLQRLKQEEEGTSHREAASMQGYTTPDLTQQRAKTSKSSCC